MEATPGAHQGDDLAGTAAVNLAEAVIQADLKVAAQMSAEAHRLVEHGAASAVFPVGSVECSAAAAVAVEVRAEGIGWEVFLMEGEMDTIPADPAGSAAVGPHQAN